MPWVVLWGRTLWGGLNLMEGEGPLWQWSPTFFWPQIDFKIVDWTIFSLSGLIGAKTGIFELMVY